MKRRLSALLTTYKELSPHQLGGSSRCECVSIKRGVQSAFLAMTLLGCGIIRERPESKASEFDIVGKPMPPDKAKEVLAEIGQNFAYGPGLGDAALNVGTAVVFPPYAIYLLGNALLSVSGYEPVTVASMLPEEQGKAWSRAYDSVVSGPGKVVAAVAGHEYRSREVGEEKMRSVFASINEQGDNQKSPNPQQSELLPPK